MKSPVCLLLLVLFWGAFIGALLIEANYRRKAALSKIRGLEAEKKKTEDAIKKAKEKRDQGRRELFKAILLFLLVIGLAVAILWLIGSGFL